MSKIAFLGLGQMGAPLASRLIHAGHTLTVWNRTPQKATSLAQQGARLAASPAEAASEVDFAITMLSTPQALEQVVFGGDGLARSLRPGQVFVDMSTVGPEAVRALIPRLPKGVSFVDAPVRGNLLQAAAGSLDVFVGATDMDFDRVRPVLEVFGRLRHTGGPGSGAAVKLVANLALEAAIVALGESLSLGEALGLPRRLLLDVLADSPIGPIVHAMRANVETGHYEPNFKLSLAAKDLRLIAEVAAAGRRDLRLARAARAWLDEAAMRGAAGLDFSAVVATILGEDALDRSERLVAEAAD